MRHKRSLLIILLFTASLIPGCKKWLVDYRNKWSGDYSFTSTKRYWTGFAWQIINEETDGKVFYKPFHNLGKSITIQISDRTAFTVDVDKAGHIKNSNNPKAEGNITTSTISFTAVEDGKPGSQYTVTATRR